MGDLSKVSPTQLEWALCRHPAGDESALLSAGMVSCDCHVTFIRAACRKFC